MSVDRLAALKQSGEVTSSSSSSSSTSSSSSSGDIDVEMADINPSLEDKQNGKGEGSDAMKDFFTVVRTINQDMNTIRANVQDMQAAHEKSLTAVDQNAIDEYNEEIKNIRNETDVIVQKIKGQLTEMKKETDKMANDTDHTADYRIRSNMNSSLTRKFVDLVGEYQSLQSSFQEKNREKIARQYKYVKPNATEDEIDEVIESGNSEFFKEAITHKASAKLNDAIHHIEVQHEEMEKLARSLIELNQLFRDMAVLVEEQGEMLNVVESNVLKAAEYTGSGVKKMESAIRNQKKARKKMCCLIVFFLIILGAVLGPVLSSAAGSA
eukprot:TRINITY_DN2201_c0_g1_i9.p1 TRINITY_DN2201_c0_g1~~TRINITY_DN2201_c0_g1_i9.p1  ORF type:complete len:324 (+),score=126.88 TRINITY_DN2201_c0_g1_i9:1442-2413(+)